MVNRKTVARVIFPAIYIRRFITSFGKNKGGHHKIAVRIILSIFDKGSFFKSVIDSHRQSGHPTGLGVPFIKSHLYA